MVWNKNVEQYLHNCTIVSFDVHTSCILHIFIFFSFIFISISIIHILGQSFGSDALQGNSERARYRHGWSASRLNIFDNLHPCWNYSGNALLIWFDVWDQANPFLASIDTSIAASHWSQYFSCILMQVYASCVFFFTSVVAYLKYLVVQVKELRERTESLDRVFLDITHKSSKRVLKGSIGSIIPPKPKMRFRPVEGMDMLTRGEESAGSNFDADKPQDGGLRPVSDTDMVHWLSDCFALQNVIFLNVIAEGQSSDANIFRNRHSKRKIGPGKPMMPC